MCWTIFYIYLDYRIIQVTAKTEIYLPKVSHIETDKHSVKEHQEERERGGNESDKTAYWNNSS